MKKLIQRVNYTTVLSYDGDGFNQLSGEMRYDNEDSPYIYFKFYLTDLAEAYIDGDSGNFIDDNLRYVVDVSIYKNGIEINYPSIDTVAWLKKANKNIINRLNEFDGFSYEIDESEIGRNKLEYRLNSPHPHIEPYDIITLFNNSLYDFDLDVYTVKEQKNIDINSDEETDIYTLKGAIGNKMGIYYIPDYDLFHFDGAIHDISDEELYDKFDNMIFDLLLQESPIEYMKKTKHDIIDVDILVPLIYWHGYPAAELWNYIKDNLFLDENESYNRAECFNYVRQYAPDVTTLQLRRIEADLLDLLAYEYPIENINKDDFYGKLSNAYNKNVHTVLWEKGPGFKNEIDNQIPKSIPHTAFGYHQEIGYKGDILYYESKEIPVKIAVQLKQYRPVIPMDKKLRFEEKREVTPFGWYAKLIGIEKLADNIDEDKIESVIQPNNMYLMHNEVFNNASQLRYKEIKEKLDIIYNKPDTSAWD